MNGPVLPCHHHGDNFTTPAFDCQQGPFTSLRTAPRLNRNRSLRNLQAYLPDQPHRLMNLVHTDPHPRPHVAVTIGHNLDLKFVVSCKRSVREALETMMDSSSEKSFSIRSSSSTIWVSCSPVRPTAFPPLRCSDKPAAGGLAPRIFNVLHE
jgi:hypothetical protein